MPRKGNDGLITILHSTHSTSHRPL